MADKIGVGIIGVALGRSWAAIAHIPALEALDDFEIVALSTTRMESARAAAAELGVPSAYDNHLDLVNDPMEMHNLYGQPGQESVTATLQAELARLKAAVQDDDQLANDQLPNGVDGTVARLRGR